MPVKKAPSYTTRAGATFERKAVTTLAVVIPPVHRSYTVYWKLIPPINNLTHFTGMEESSTEFGPWVNVATVTITNPTFTEEQFFSAVRAKTNAVTYWRFWAK